MTAFRIIIVFLAMVLSPGLARAESAITKGIANAYYKNCISRDDQRMSDSAQSALCSCSAAQMIEKMSIEEVFRMKKELGPGRIEYDKMLTEVYGPCMEVPVEETLYNECMNDSKVEQFYLRDKNKLCRCTSQKSARYLADNGVNVMTYLLKDAPAMEDPMDYILNDGRFRQQAYNNLYVCFKQ